MSCLIKQRLGILLVSFFNLGHNYHCCRLNIPSGRHSPDSTHERKKKPPFPPTPREKNTFHNSAAARSSAPMAPRLSVAPELEGVLPLPGLPPAAARVVVAVALVEAAGLLAGGREAAGLAVLVDGVDDPVDAGVHADGLVLRVDEDDLVVLVRRVLVDPVRVEDAEVGAAAADTLLGDRAEGALELELVDTLVGGLACGGVRLLFGFWEGCVPDCNIP